MRNLKRALSLALAAAMLIGMMVVGASAASYKDADSIKNTEAVEVLTGIGVVGGSNGSYNPEKTLTRAEFCVMIANALTGGKFDKSLFDGANTPFTDISGHWGASYIAYCYTAGVIAGTGDGTTFSPDKSLTAAQAEAILLSALGYNKNGEFGLNGQFELNVTTWAQQAGLLKGVSVIAKSPITRDAMAQILFNALTNTTPVGYSKLAETYYTVGTNALSGVVLKGDDLADKDGAPASDAYCATLGFTNFGLKYGVASEDAYNRPAHKWVSTTNANIGTYASKPAFTYTAKTTEASIKADLTGYTYATAPVYLNGNDTAVTTVASNANLAARTANGKLVEVYTNVQNQVTKVVEVETFLAKASADYDAAKDELGLIVQNDAITLASSAKVKAEDFPAAADVKKDQYVLITVAHNGANYDVTSLAPATVVEKAVVNAYKAQESVTYGTETRKYNNASANQTGSLGYTILNDTEHFALGNKYDLYLDQYGYVIGAKASTGTVAMTDYAFVANVGPSGLSYAAKLVFPDGSAKEVTVTKTNGTAVSSASGESQAPTAGELKIGNFVTYDIDKNGNYELTYVYTVKSDSETINYSANGAKVISNVNYIATADTVFVAKDKAYNGVTNAPVVAAGPVYYIVDNTNTYLKLVYTGTPGTAVTSASEMVYVVSTTYTVGKDADKNTYYVWDAIVNGTKTALTTNNPVLSRGLYKIGSYTNGYADLTTAASDAKVYVAGDDAGVKYNSSVLKFTSGTAYTVADDVVVYTIDTTTGNAVATIGTGSIEYKAYNDGFDTITLVFNKNYTADAKVVAIYMQK